MQQLELRRTHLLELKVRLDQDQDTILRRVQDLILLSLQELLTEEMLVAQRVIINLLEVITNLQQEAILQLDQADQILALVDLRRHLVQDQDLILLQKEEVTNKFFKKKFKMGVGIIVLTHFF